MKQFNLLEQTHELGDYDDSREYETDEYAELIEMQYDKIRHCIAVDKLKRIPKISELIENIRIKFHDKRKKEIINAIIYKRSTNETNFAELLYHIKPETFFYVNEGKKTDGTFYYYNEYGIYERQNAAPESIFNFITTKLLKYIIKCIDIEKAIYSSQYAVLTLEEDKNNMLIRIDKLEKLKSTIIEKIGCHTFQAAIVAVLKNLCNVSRKLNGNYDFVALLDKTAGYVMPFNNGVFDLTTLTFRKARRDEFVSLTCGYDYVDEPDPDATAYIKKILRSIFEVKEERDYILGIIAIAMNSDIRWEHFMIFDGPGGNGKGVLSTLMSSVFGSLYFVLNANYVTDGSSKKDPLAPDVVLDSLRRAKIVVTGEPSTAKNARFDEQVLKLLTGGDKITCRGLYQDLMIVNFRFKLFLQTNTFINVDGTSAAIKRRLIYTKFRNNFVVGECVNKNDRPSDPQLKQKIETGNKYKIALFHILRKKYHQYVAEVIPNEMPKYYEKATKNYLYQNNPVKLFIDTCIIKTEDPRDRISLKTLYEEFRSFLPEDDNAQLQKPKDISEKFRNYGFIQSKNKHGACFDCIKIRGDDSEFVENDKF